MAIFTKGRLRLLSIVFGLLAAISVLPHDGADVVSPLGYKAVCPFAPLSTLLALYAFLTLYRYAGSPD